MGFPYIDVHVPIEFPKLLPEDWAIWHDMKYNAAFEGLKDVYILPAGWNHYDRSKKYRTSEPKTSTQERLLCGEDAESNAGWNFW